MDRLPDDLVIEIFDLNVVPSTPDGSYAYDQGSLRSLRAVCRRWSELFWAIPRFWRVIRVGRRQSIKWLELCMSHVAQRFSTLDFHFHDDLRGLPLLLEAERGAPIIRSLHFSFHQSPFASELQLQPLLSRHIPNLESISFSLSPSSLRDGGSRQALTPSPCLVPKLKKLAYSSVKSPTNFAVYPNLRDLSLSAWYCDGVTFDELLDIIATCGRIEALSLSGMITHSGPSNAPEYIDEPLRRPQIILPNLRRFSLCHPHIPFHNYHILAHLRLPNITHLEVTDDVNELCRRDFLEMDETFSLHLPPSHAVVLPFLQEITDIKLSAFEWDEAELSGRSRRGGSARPVSFKLALSRDDGWQNQPSWGPLTHSCVSHLADFLSYVPNVTHLHLGVHFDHLGFQLCKRLFEATPRLQSLVLTGAGVPRCVLEALLPPAPSAPASVTVAPSETLLPNLNSLRIGDEHSLFHHPEVVDSIWETLRLRAAAGLRLEELVLHLMHKTEKEYEMRLALDLPRLAQGV